MRPGRRPDRSPLVPEVGVRFPAFDGLRGGACVAITLAHAYGLTYGSGGALIGYAAHVANAMVVDFFALSGFVLWRPFADAAWTGARSPGLRRFARNRLFRVVPSYWAALFVLGSLTPGAAPGVFGAHGPALFAFAQVYSERSAFLGIKPAWTLCVEMGFYLLMPALLAVVGVTGRPEVRRLGIGLCAVAGLAVATQVAATVDVASSARPLLAFSTLLGNFDAFAIGIAAATASVVVGESRSLGRRSVAVGWIAWVALPIFAGAVLPAAVGWGPDESVGAWLAAHELRLVGAALLLVLVAFGPPDAPGTRWLTRPALGWAGLISFNVYIWHEPVLIFLARHRWTAVDGSALAFILIATPISIAVGAAAHLLIERPVWRLRHRIPVDGGFAPAEPRSGPSTSDLPGLPTESPA